MFFWPQRAKPNVLLNIVNLFLFKCLQSRSVHLVFCCFIIHLDQSLCGTNFPWYQFCSDVGCSIFRWNPDTANTNISPFCCSQADTFSRTTSNHDLRATAWCWERRLMEIWNIWHYHPIAISTWSFCSWIEMGSLKDFDKKYEQNITSVQVCENGWCQIYQI